MRIGAPAGVDYLYSVHELLDAEAFLATILSPRPANATQRLLPPGHWQGQGLTGAPDFTAAIDAAERNPAGSQVIFDLPGKRHPEPRTTCAGSASWSDRS